MLRLCLSLILTEFRFCESNRQWDARRLKSTNVWFDNGIHATLSEHLFLVEIPDSCWFLPKIYVNWKRSKNKCLCMSTGYCKWLFLVLGRTCFLRYFKLHKPYGNLPLIFFFCFRVSGIFLNKWSRCFFCVLSD